MKYLLFILLLIGCGHQDEPLPTCPNITARYDGERLRMTVTSQSEYITICRDFPTRTQCDKILSDYFGCIRIAAYKGEIITVIDGNKSCQIEAK